jgi:hypothetical protein
MDAAALVHHLSFKFSFQGLDLAQPRKAGGGDADLPLQLAEDFVQALGGGPEGGVVLAMTAFHVHGCSEASLTTSSSMTT